MQVRTLLRPRRLAPTARLAVLHALASLIVNLAIYSSPSSVYHPAAAMGDQFIPWAIGVNVSSAALVLLFALALGWNRRFGRFVLFDLVTSLFPFAMLGYLAISDPELKREIFGVIYIFFIFSKGLLLIWVALANVKDGTDDKRVGGWILAVSLLNYAAITPWVAFNAWPDADEPHYLLLTHSLVADHDFDLSNNYSQRDYKSYYPPDLPDHHSLINSRGQEFAIHDVGISALLVPGYAAAGRLGAMVELNIVGALLALGLYVLAISIGASQRAAIVAWSLFAFTSPLVVYSSQIYPEVVGGASSVWAVITFARFVRTHRIKFLLLIGFLVGLLPWLSVRYWMVVGPMLSVVALYVIARMRGGSKITAINRLFALILPVLLSIGLFALFDLRHYNTAMPNAGYFLYIKAMRPPMFSPDIYVGLPGLFFDRAYGLLTTAPVYILALAGAWVLVKRRPWVGGAILLPSLTYTLFAGFNLFWYGGWAPPSRYIFLAAALLAPLASLVVLNRAFGFVAWVAGIWSFLVSAGFTAFPLTRYTFWDVNSGALSQFVREHFGVDYGTIFPSFIRASAIDYALASAWAGAVIACIWLLSQPRTNRDVISEPF